MIQVALAEKLGMTHIYDNLHRHVPVTVLRVLPQAITGWRQPEKDGIAAVQIGATGRKRVAKPQRDELKALNIDLPIAHRAEIRLAKATPEPVQIGAKIDAAVFAIGQKVTITGTSKGKGFAGTIKRHGFHRGPSTHGSKNVRQPGSIGSGYPQRVIAGQRMAGHMGHVTVTTKGHTIMAINLTDQTVAVSGAVPGAYRNRVLVKSET